MTKIFHKKRRRLRYKEIFSSAKNLRNTQNTSPLEFNDDTIKQSVGESTENAKNWLDRYSERKKKILQQEILEWCPEYNGPLYTHAVKNSLRKEIKNLTNQSLWLCLIFTLSVCLDFFVKLKPKFLSIPFFSTSSLHLIISTFLLILSFILGFKTIKKGCIHLANVIFTIEAGVVFPAIATTANCFVSLFLSFFYTNFQPNTFTSLFLLELLLIIVTNLTREKRAFNNLRFIASSKQKFNVEVSSLDKITNLKKSKCKNFVAYQHKTNFLSDFIKNSHEESFSEKLVSNFIPISVVFSLFCGILSVVFTQNAVSSLVALNISALISLPFALPLVSSLIVSSLSKFALKNKSMVVGENAVKKLSAAKSVVLTDTDLYPKNNVILRGIKTFSGQRVDEAIVLAATVVCRLRAPISHVFDKIILGKKAVLTKASNVKYIDGKGAVGWVNGQRVLVGNRGLLKEYKIAPPSHDYEEKYKKSNCELTYFSLGRELVAMFIIEYLPSKSLSSILHSCVKNNIKILIKTVDCNITLQKIINDFGVRKKLVKILTNKERQTAEAMTKKEVDKTSAFATTFGECSSVLRVMCEANRVKEILSLIFFIQGLQTLLSIFLLLYLIPERAIMDLHNLGFLFCAVFCLVLSLIPCKVKLI